MTPPEALQAAREAAGHLDAAHEKLAEAKRGWDPKGSCPCGPPALRDALEGVAEAIRRVQEVTLPVPGERD